MRRLLARTALLLQAERKRTSVGKITLEDLASEELVRLKGSPTSRTPAQRARSLSNELLAALETVKDPEIPQTPSVLLVFGQ